MISSSSSAQLNYLENASQRLLVSSPAVSAYLQSERNATLDKVDEVVSKGSNRSCNACGNIMIPGWSCERVKPVKGSQGGGKNRSYSRLHELRKLRCSMCNAITTVEAEEPPQANKDLNSTNSPAETHKDRASSVPTTTPQQKANDMKTSNRRARSKKSTLQSMLADQKKTEVEKPKGFGLDLMDLIQS